MNHRDRPLMFLVRIATPFLAAFCASACLVVSLHPAFDPKSIAWEDALLGTWYDADDNVTIEIQRGEWRSYRVRYEHPIESGDLTGYLTGIGNDRFMNLTAARGQDHGSFLVPVHAIVRVRLEGNTLGLTPLSYDWFFDRLRSRKGISGLAVTFDQKENAVITSATASLRAWLRAQPRDGAVFGASAEFVRR